MGVGSIVVAVGVEEDAEPSEVVLRAEHLSNLVRLLHVPDGHSVSEQGPCGAVDTEVDHQFPVPGHHWLKFSLFFH